MVVMDYSTELEFGVDRFLEILTDYEKLPEYLPRQLQRIEIVDKDDNYTIIKAVILLRSLIKREFILEIKIEKKSDEIILAEILDGIAKGTKITISIFTQEEKTMCKISTDTKLSLKIIVLLPIIKREYKGFVSGVLNNIFTEMKSKEMK
tara:strand:- start:796 stop:1245 length:450 start_codon:yes stop_codon:yes gene_type:complete